MRRTEQKKVRGLSKLGLFLKISIILVTSALICITVYGVYLTKKAEHAVNSAYEVIENREVSEKREVKIETVKDNVSILFIGIDDSETRRQGAENSRSDALMLATLNNTTKTIKLLSIPRDSYVYIPYVGYEDKINHAHAYGGTLALIETIEDLLDIPVDYYVRMNFNAFIEVIDALGGIEAEVPYAMLEKDEFDRNIISLQPGLQILNGQEALALARTRKQDTDVERGKRQQEILKAIITKVASVSSLTKYDDIIEAISDNMKTNMTFKEMKSFISYLSNGVPSIDSLTLQGYDDMSTGVYYYKLDEESFEETQHILKSHLGILPDNLNVSETPTNELNKHTQSTTESQ